MGLRMGDRRGVCSVYLVMRGFYCMQINAFTVGLSNAFINAVSHEWCLWIYYLKMSKVLKMGIAMAIILFIK